MLGSAKRFVNKCQEIINWTEKVGLAAAIGIFGCGLVVGVASYTIWRYFYPPAEIIELSKLQKQNEYLKIERADLEKKLQIEKNSLQQARNELSKKDRDSDNARNKYFIELKSLQDENKSLKSRIEKPTEEQVIAEVKSMNPKIRWQNLRLAEQIDIGQKIMIFNDNIALFAEDPGTADVSDVILGHDRCRFVSESRSSRRTQNVLKVGYSAEIKIAGIYYVVKLVDKKDNRCMFSYNFRAPPKG